MGETAGGIRFKGDFVKLVIFAEALGAYRRRSWDEAIEKFHQSTEKSGEDGPSRFYITLCENYKKNPPEEPWNEVVHIDRK